MKGRTLSIALLGLLATQLSFAAKNRFFPPGCRQKGFEFHDHQLIMQRLPQTEKNSQLETIYLVYNKTQEAIVLKTAIKSRYLPSYKKTIPANHWAAFARTEDQIKFQCSTKPRFKHDLGNTIDCYEALTLCNYNRAKFPSQNLGTYWLQRTSPNQRAMMRVAIKKGILLRW